MRKTKWETIETADKSFPIIALSPAHEDGTSPIILRWFKYNGKEAWRDWDGDPHFPTHYLDGVPFLPQAERQLEEPPLGGDEVSAEHQSVGLTPIEAAIKAAEEKV
jgi:hypothetical protein